MGIINNVKTNKQFGFLNIILFGPGSSVDKGTDFGLEGFGIESGGDEISRPPRQALRHTQPSVKWVPDLSRG